MKIGIIGTGISGLGAAYLLSPHHDITVYEKNAYIGGHSRTIDVVTPSENFSVDTGFIVFNDWNYPNLMGLFNRLEVPYVKSSMSFGVSIDNAWLEYASGELLALRNLIKPAYWGMLLDITKFNKQALQYLESSPDISLGQCLDALKMGDWFKNYYLLAMGAAIWSCPLETILTFPARTFLQFFKNHGLLSVNKRPQWYTVRGGSKEYVERLTATYKQQIQLQCGVVKVRSHKDKVELSDTLGNTTFYDQVIFACHADEALSMLADPKQSLKDVIGAFSYQENRVVVHCDTSFMPKSKKSWSSWVYLSDSKQDTKPVVSLSYWMNNLQPISSAKPVIVTLNPGVSPREELSYDEHVFSHPVFDSKAIQAQQHIDSIQGQDGLWFCGAYQRYGFHEDGLLSAVNIAAKMGVPIPWH
ncbi:MAG: FAD-dependent oxidoreductase [Cellvibrionaceae bacterium]|nr:FAD-dependent oxidoreductase [Cellvibrionaceae bacterium]